MWINWVKRNYSAIIKWLGTYHTDLSLTPRNLIVWEEYTMHEQNSWDKVWAIRSTQGQTFSPLCLESPSGFAKEELQWLLMPKKCTICFASLTMTSRRWHSYGETLWEKNRMCISSREQCLEKCLYHPERKEAKCWWEWERLTPGCEKQSTSTFTWMMAYHQRILVRKLLNCGSRWLSCSTVEVSTYTGSDKWPRRLGDHPGARKISTIPRAEWRQVANRQNLGRHLGCQGGYALVYRTEGWSRYDKEEDLESSILCLGSKRTTPPIHYQK